MKLWQLIILLKILSYCYSSPFEINTTWTDSIDVDDTINDVNYEDQITSKRVCNTEECQLISSTFIGAMNKSVNPCDDFYEFTCGNWKAKDYLPDDQVQMSRFKLFQSLVERDMKELLEDKFESDDFEPIKKARRWYQSCMDESGREKKGIKTLEFLAFVMGGWPMVINYNEWDGGDYSWQTVDQYYASLTGQHAFFRIVLHRIPRAGSFEKYMVLGQPQLPLHNVLPLINRNYTDNDLVSYRNLLRQVARLFIDRNGQTVSDNQLAKDIDDVIGLEKKLYQAMYRGIDYATFDSENIAESAQFSLDQLRDADDNEIKSEEKLHTEMQWETIIENLFKLANVDVDNNAIVVIHSNEFFASLPEILESSSKRTIVNYIHWRVMSQLLPYTNDKANYIYLKYMKYKFGLTKRLPRWRECIKGMKMSHAVGYTLAKKYYRNDTAQAIENMAKKLKRSLAHMIERSNWLSRQAKKSLKAKLADMKTLLGFPDWYERRSQVADYYKELTVGDDYVENALSFLRHQKIYEIREFVGLHNSSGWMMDPMSVNAAYIYLFNALNIPAVDFQYPLFGTNVPDYVNYGITGHIMGHEMGHGFDVMGIRIMVNDKIVGLKTKMITLYDEQVNCFINQFDRYFDEERLQLQSITSPPSHLAEFIRKKRNSTIGTTRGSVTKAENIADAIGLETAFNAYMNLKSNKHVNGELKLPRFEKFTDKQMFFISFAQTWCEVATAQYTLQNTRSLDSHSPGKFRVLGGVSNNEAFAKAFSCPPGSPMNPVAKCNIWKKENNNRDGTSLMLDHPDKLD